LQSLRVVNDSTLVRLAGNHSELQHCEMKLLTLYLMVVLSVIVVH